MPQPSTTAHNGPPLYSVIHKGIRERLFKFSASAGRLDYAESSRVKELNDEFTLLVSSIRLHHSHEEQFAHPLISDRVPGGAVRLEEEHKLVDQRMNEMTAHLEGIITKTGNFERCRDLGLEFYLSFNRFLAFFLNHIDDEEERVQRALFDLCTVEELINTLGRVLSSQKPDELMDNLKMVLSGANMDDLTGLFFGAKFLIAPEVFQNAVRLAETILSPADWSILKSTAQLE